MKKNTKYKNEDNKNFTLVNNNEHISAVLIDTLLNSYLNVDESCPILHVEYTCSMPPYKPDCCSHRMSLVALSDLEVYKLNDCPGAAFQICPFCRLPIRFASLDHGYLRCIELKKILTQIKDIHLQGEVHSLQDPEREQKANKVDADCSSFQMFIKDVPVGFETFQRKENTETDHYSPEGTLLELLKYISTLKLK